MVKELPNPEWREVMSNPTAWLWDVNYLPTFVRELQIYEAMGLFAKAAELLDTAPASTYLQQHRGTEAKQIKRMTEDVRALMRWCAEAVHRRNKLLLPPTMVARTISALGHKVNTHAWQEDGTTLTKPTGIKLIHQMVKCRPSPHYAESPRVVVYVLDQVYRHADSRHSRKAGTSQDRIDGDGHA